MLHRNCRMWLILNFLMETPVSAQEIIAAAPLLIPRPDSSMDTKVPDIMAAVPYPLDVGLEDARYPTSNVPLQEVPLPDMDTATIENNAESLDLDITHPLV